MDDKMETMMNPRLDCRHYLGEKPCKFKCLCRECTHFEPIGIRVLVLKLGAMGDALRTTPVLAALKRLYTHCRITWVTDPASYPVLAGNPLIDSLLLTSFDQIFPLTAQRFDLLLCLDKDPVVTSLAMRVDSIVRRGFAMSPFGTLDIFNDASSYALELGLDDELKFRQNTKTYQQIIYEMAELPFTRDEYIYRIPENDLNESRILFESFQPEGTGPAIGLNTGCGDVFATKKWPDSHFIELARMLRKRLDARIFLLGGKSELASNAFVAEALKGQVVETGANPLGVFAGLLQQMDAVVASDTMALHLALAVKTPVIGLFGPTCAQEIDFYDRGEPLVITDDCSPCYRKKCRKEISCMHNLLPEQVFQAVLRYVK